jgi:DNA polymerase I
MEKSLTDLVNPEYNVILVDAMNVSAIHFHSKKMLSYRGKPTGMLYGVMRQVKSLQDLYPGVPIFFLWEGRKSRRKASEPSYKNNRHWKRDQGFVDSIDDVHRALSLAGIRQVNHEGLEADDLAGYYSKRLRPCLLVSNDKDWWQFSAPSEASGGVDVMVKNEVFTYDKLTSRLGYPPSKIPLMKLLKGDSSDNIPGIPRFPSKLALQVVKASEEAGQLFSATDLLSPRWGKVMLDNKAQLSKSVSLIVYHDNWVNESHVRDVVPARRDPKALVKFLLSRGIKSLAQGWFD